MRYALCAMRIYPIRKETVMPNVSITMIAGRPPEKKEELIKKVTDAITESLGVPKESVHIALYEVPKENIGEAGIPLSKKKP
jgi:4-oxalocrotonate tautomerase